MPTINYNKSTLATYREQLAAQQARIAEAEAELEAKKKIYEDETPREHEAVRLHADSVNNAVALLARYSEILKGITGNLSPNDFAEKTSPCANYKIQVYEGFRTLGEIITMNLARMKDAINHKLAHPVRTNAAQYLSEELQTANRAVDKTEEEIAAGTFDPANFTQGDAERVAADDVEKRAAIAAFALCGITIKRLLGELQENDGNPDKKSNFAIAADAANTATRTFTSTRTVPTVQPLLANLRTLTTKRDELLTQIAETEATIERQENISRLYTEARAEAARAVPYTVTPIGGIPAPARTPEAPAPTLAA